MQNEECRMQNPPARPVPFLHSAFPYTPPVTRPRLLDLSAEVDRLYQLPLAEFTAARNALVKRVQAEHGGEAAGHIRTLAKPSIAAWTLNQLHWRHRTDFMALLLAGDALRQAQQQRLGGADVDLGPPMRARQDAMDTLLAHAADLLKEAGHQPRPEMRQRLQASLDALAAYGTAEAGPRPGRLTAEVPPPGFAALAGLMPASPPATAAAASRDAGARPRLKVVARREREKAQAALASAEAALAAARDAADRAAEALARADAEWQAARQQLAEAQRVLDEATTREQQARAEREQRKRDVARAGLALRDATRAVEKAARALQD